MLGRGLSSFNSGAIDGEDDHHLSSGHAAPKKVTLALAHDQAIGLVCGRMRRNRREQSGRDHAKSIGDRSS